ncbi:MAG: Glu/Leu/Phe/Val dehydrogenase, partial [Thermoanaerobaculales bacterium]|nr:Glu/Leu/Phe/Val dehydrogenase [Thermoanaerobaculales bacterium]
MNGNSFNPFAAAQAQFDRVAGLMGLDESVRTLLRRPSHEHHFAIPVRMDDRRVRVFDGYRVVHNDARGPAWGGVRFHPQETPDTLRALAMWMTWKTAIVDIPLGGSMGGAVCDPHDLSRWEQEALCRGWVRRLARDLGPERDVVAPDIMTHAAHMTWMLDEFEVMHGGRHPGAITGKPVPAGGTRGRREAAGYGLVYTLREALKEISLAPDRAVASVQGFGLVGRHAVELFTRIGGKVRCVSCLEQRSLEPTTFVRPEGIDFEQLKDLTDPFGNIDRERAEVAGFEVKGGDAWLAEPVDILIPAALENQINVGNCEQVARSVKLVVEGANGPTSEGAEAALGERGVRVIPDLVANAGGVLCSYFEQVQAASNAYWRLAEVMSRLDVQLTDA